MCSRGKGLNLQPNFEKGVLDKVLNFRGQVAEKKWITPSGNWEGDGGVGGWGGSWVCSFYIKNKLNSEIFYQTGNSAKNLVTFKIWMGLRTKIFNIMGVH